MCKVVEERTIVNPKAGETAYSSSGYALPTDPKDKGKVESTGSKEVQKSVSSTSKKSTNQESTSSSSTTSKKKLETSKPSKAKAGPTPASVAMLSYHEFTEKYADLIEEFMTKSTLSQSKDFLIQHGDILLQENAANYLLLASLEDEMNGLRDKMRLTARQSQLISNITELAKSMKTHPGNVIIPFFKRLEEKVHLMGFNKGWEAFVQNLIKRAVVKKKEIDEEKAKEIEENGVDLHEIPKEERLGPGGLDPIEVFESLPSSLQEAFESRDTDVLKKALTDMPPEEAEMHMKRCVDSGLWNQNSEE